MSIPLALRKIFGDQLKKDANGDFSGTGKVKAEMGVGVGCIEFNIKAKIKKDIRDSISFDMQIIRPFTIRSCMAQIEVDDCADTKWEKCELQMSKQQSIIGGIQHKGEVYINADGEWDEDVDDYDGM